VADVEGPNECVFNAVCLGPGGAVWAVAEHGFMVLLGLCVAARELPEECECHIALKYSNYLTVYFLIARPTMTTTVGFIRCINISLVNFSSE
jgi:hypothetical protein